MKNEISIDIDNYCKLKKSPIGRFFGRITNMKKDYAVYWIAFKILLKNGNKILFLRASDRGLFDLPGGRADNSEGKMPIKKIINREVKEELGDEIKYRLGSPIFQYRRYSIKMKIYNLITVYKAEYISGSVKLSPEHNVYKWIDPRTYKFEKKDFYNKEEYETFKEYFKKQ